MKKIALLSLFAVGVFFLLQGMTLAVETVDTAAKAVSLTEEGKTETVAAAIPAAETVKEEAKKEETVAVKTVAEPVAPAPVAAEPEKKSVL